MRSMTAVRAAVLAVLAACGTTDQTVGPERIGAPQLAKNSPAMSTTWTVADLAGVASDGRGDYVDGECGVRAEVYPISGGNGTLRPAESRSRCGYVRAVSANIGTAMLSAAGLGAIGIWDVPVGSTAPIDFNINTGTASCARLVYTAATGGQVQATAGINGAGKRTWLIESVAPHAAGCLRSVQNSWVWDGVQLTVPMRVTVVER